jgi:stage IV sporulation protein B
MFYFPSQIDIFKGDSKELELLFPFTATILEDKYKIIEIDNNKFNLKINNSLKLKTKENGNAKIQLKLLGIIPIKSVNVNVVDKIYLLPGGQAIGVKLNTKGVLVVALAEIEDVNGNEYCPAKDAGIRVGDSIIAINDIEVKDSDHVISLLNSFKDRKIELTILRNNSIFKTHIEPVKSGQDNCYRLGVWVRDKTAGIGTLTFYHPESKKFGALGHGITDIDTGNIMISENGEIMKATISSVQQGKKGVPGEIVGIFFESEDILGRIEKNTKYGIYGTAYKKIENKYFNEIMPIAFRDEVKEGRAYILSTIEKDIVKKYEINIEKLQAQSKPNQKSMIIKVVDPELLAKTGGIVQGMSGSPIIQNGKIVGAVTHVFVNDPKKGYGIYIEWMLREAGILDIDDKEFALSE